MAFLVSPGVEVKEKDLTNIIPAVSTSIGAFAGLFEWGPALEATTVSSEADLIAKFGYPKISTNAASNSRLDWYQAANYLGYSNNLSLVRILPEGAKNAASESTVVDDSYINILIQGTTSVPNVAINVPYDGTNTVSITPTSTDSDGSLAVKLANALTAAGVSQVTYTTVPGTVRYLAGTFTKPATTTLNSLSFSYFWTTAPSTVGQQTTAASIANADEWEKEKEGVVNGSVYAKYPGKYGNSVGIVLVDAGISATDFENHKIFGNVTLASLFDDKPETSTWGEAAHNANLYDEVHVVVYAKDATITGTANDVLEVYPFLSKAKNGKSGDSGPNYYVDVINEASNYVWIQNEETYATSAVLTTDTGEAIGSTLTAIVASNRFKYFVTNVGVAGIRKYELDGGHDGTSVTDGNYTAGYDKFKDVEAIDVSLMITGSRSKTVQKYCIEIAETRKDCIAFVSPDYNSAVVNPSAAKIVEYFNNDTYGFNSTSYAVFDSAWKRQYDRYNDEYFWTPLNADIAGVTARTDLTNDAWWSPAGLNRGFIKNVVKLSYNPNQTDRDTLYPKRINPVVTFRGQGTLLYGDKTALKRPSAFDRINVRRLFIVLEKAIATASKYQLFEFNDDFTRRQFVNAVEPFLSNVKTRRGLYDFRVVCDESNNTAEIIDSNRFVADIYIKPARSINFITLNFVAVRSGVSFSEVVGA